MSDLNKKICTNNSTWTTKEFLSDYYKAAEECMKEIDQLKEEKDVCKAALANLSLFVSVGIEEVNYFDGIKNGFLQIIRNFFAVNGIRLVQKF